MKKLTAVLLIAAALPSQGYTWTDTLQAIRQVETGGQPNEGRGAVGDGGRALGPLQIHRVYHVDPANGGKGDTGGPGKGSQNPQRRPKRLQKIRNAGLLEEVFEGRKASGQKELGFFRIFIEH